MGTLLLVESFKMNTFVVFSLFVSSALALPAGSSWGSGSIGTMRSGSWGSGTMGSGSIGTMRSGSWGSGTMGSGSIGTMRSESWGSGTMGSGSIGTMRSGSWGSGSGSIGTMRLVIRDDEDSFSDMDMGFRTLDSGSSSFSSSGFESSGDFRDD